MKMVALGDVAWIQSHIVDPSHVKYSGLLHVSGENILPVTGELCNVRTVAEDGMESGKYLFDLGDVLYSKLRPYLRKAAVADFAGLCSADMYPIKINPIHLIPDYLRSILVSDSFTAFANELSARSRMPKLNREQLFSYRFRLPPIDIQRLVVARLKARLSEVKKAHQALAAQLCEMGNLADAIVLDSIRKSVARKYFLSDILDEVKNGIGKDWSAFPVWGATRDGLAPAKEPPGKKPERYKPAFPGTVFYNPMRILIGSIAFVDEDDKPGITSPDYVALRGKEGVVDSRWFYYWLRSPLGKQCITSLARGAVRERMLFNRLAGGYIELPNFKLQQAASKALAELKHLRKAIEMKMNDLNLLPTKILSQVFEM
jgi:type I restriction enzyme, S subunit